MYSKISRNFLFIGAMTIFAACHPSTDLAQQVSEKVITEDALPPLSKSQNYHRNNVLSQLEKYELPETSDSQKGYIAQLISLVGRED